MQNRESFLIHVMNAGFSKAAASFSRLVNRHVKIINSQSVLIRHEDDFSCISEEQGDLYVLITQIIGDVAGKSFLIFNEEESNEIFSLMKTPVANKALHEAFLLEIDNIISASVIAEISNKLGLDIYGDVPRLSKIHARDLQGFLIGKTMIDEPSSMILTNTTFLLDSKEKIHPQFIWKLSSKIFEMISDKKITA
jgi:chemotaxis protein CheY-P-specific phosphatase CheC